MSSDNYFLVRPWGDKFVVSMEFASDDKDHANEPVELAFGLGMTRVFADQEAAENYAFGEYAEYGVSYVDTRGPLLDQEWLDKITNDALRYLSDDVIGEAKYIIQCWDFTADPVGFRTLRPLMIRLLEMAGA